MASLQNTEKELLEAFILAEKKVQELCQQVEKAKDEMEEARDKWEEAIVASTYAEQGKTHLYCK